jgi:glycosyltransferase involved in cell wall biosynthesis
MEVVIVDDCSEDDTPSMVENFKKSQQNIVYKRNEMRTGAAMGFLKAAELATGDYLLNFSDDDLLTDSAINSFVEPLGKADYDIIYSDLGVIDQDNNQTTVWNYKSYTDSLKLLRKLMDSGCNVIPEVSLIKKEIYSKLYGEMYSKRFITPFYLSSLPHLKMFHINKPLYKYRVHKNSTFSDISGLIVRNKGVLNFLNLIMFRYSPIDIFQTKVASSLNEQIVDAIIQFVRRLFSHANCFVSGEFYTGAKYREKDYLWCVFYEYAYYWLMLACKYKADTAQAEQLLKKIEQFLSPEIYDSIKVNQLPAIYRHLPWFSYMPINQVTEFIAFDMVTFGENSFLDQNYYYILREENIDIKATNKVVCDIEELKSYLKHHSIQVINIFDSTHFEEVLDLIEKEKRFFTCIVNATDKTQSNESLLKNSINIEAYKIRDFKNYLKILSLPIGNRYRSKNNS